MARLSLLRSLDDANILGSDAPSRLRDGGDRKWLRKDEVGIVDAREIVQTKATFPMRSEVRSFVFALALSAAAGAARADVTVTGTLDHLHIEASNAPIVEVMEALKKQFGIAYRYRVPPDWTVDGAFTGSLLSILPRVFRDKDYIFRIEPDHSLTVFFPSPQGPASAEAVPPPQGPPSAAPIPPPIQALGPKPPEEGVRRRRLNPADPSRSPDPAYKAPQ